MTKQSKNAIQSERRKRFLDHPGFLTRLAQRNLIDIGVDTTNKRRSRIDLTSKGRQLLSRTDSLDKAVSRLYLSPLTGKEQERFKELLYKVAFNGRNPGPEFYLIAVKSAK